MSTPAKILLGIVTLLPMLFGICFLVYYLSIIKDMILSLPTNIGDQQMFVRDYMVHIFSGRLILCGVLSVITHVALMIYYILHVVNHKVKSEGEKIMWILLFIFIGTIPFIIYFFLRIVPAQNEEKDMRIM